MRFQILVVVNHMFMLHVVIWRFIIWWIVTKVSEGPSPSIFRVEGGGSRILRNVGKASLSTIYSGWNRHTKYKFTSVSQGAHLPQSKLNRRMGVYKNRMCYCHSFLFRLRRCQDLDLGRPWWMKYWKELEGKRSWTNRGTIRTFAWRN